MALDDKDTHTRIVIVEGIIIAAAALAGAPVAAAAGATEQRPAPVRSLRADFTLQLLLPHAIS